MSITPVQVAATQKPVEQASTDSFYSRDKVSKTADEAFRRPSLNPSNSTKGLPPHLLRLERAYRPQLALLEEANGGSVRWKDLEQFAEAWGPR